MLRDILSSRAFLAGLACFVLIAGGTQLYSWHVERGIREDEARTKRFLQSIETKAVPVPAKTIESASPANHNHSHDTASHSHAAEDTTSRDTYDWREGSVFDAPQSTVDPWKQTYAQEADAESSDSENAEQYPPRDWYKTKDPLLRAEYFYAQLLKQFGDIPEVHIIGEHKLQMAQKVPIHIDKYIEYLEALHTLWPDDKTSKLIDDIQKDKAKGVKFIFE